MLLSWDYARLLCLGIKGVVEHFPRSLALLHKDAIHGWDFALNGKLVRATPERLGKEFGLDGPQPLISMPHHENPAAFVRGDLASRSDKRC